MVLFVLGHSIVILAGKSFSSNSRMIHLEAKSGTGYVCVSLEVGLMGKSRNTMVATSISLINGASRNLTLGTGLSTTGDSKNKYR